MTSWGRTGTVVFLVAGIGLLVARAVASTSSGAVVTGAGKEVTAVRLVGSTDAVSTQSKTWVDVAGASVDVRVPGGTSALIVVDLSGEATCVQSQTGWDFQCTARILVDGSEALPAAGYDFAFARDFGTSIPVAPEAHSMERWAGPLTAGIHHVQVQYAAVPVLQDTPPEIMGTFTLDDWTLKTERVRA